MRAALLPLPDLAATLQIVAPFARITSRPLRATLVPRAVEYSLVPRRFVATLEVAS